jgi:hypothetical protein
VVRHGAVETEPAKPPISEVQVDLVAEPPLRPEPEAIAYNQHPDHQLRVDRRPACLAVERRQLPPQLSQVHKAVYGPEQVVGRHMAIEREVVEQRALVDLPRTHHLLRLRLSAGVNQRDRTAAIEVFFNGIGAERTSGRPDFKVGFPPIADSIRAS